MAKRQAKTKKEDNGKELRIPAINTQTLWVKVKGISPLIIQRFGEKARRTIGDKHEGIPDAGREKRDPKADYERCFYRLPNGKPGWPVGAFKDALVRGAKGTNVEMTLVKASVFLVGDLVEIHGTPRMVTHNVRNSGRGQPVDLRHRPCFDEWWAELVISYDANAFTAEEVVNLLNRGGSGCGVAEGRPFKSNTLGWGRFQTV